MQDSIDTMTQQEIIDNFNLNELNNQDDYEDFSFHGDADDNSTEHSDFSVRKRKRSKPDTKDKNYHNYNIIKKGMNIKIEVFSTRNVVGALIRCPHTGIRSNDRVGSKDEDFYFKVSMPAISNGDEAVVLFYSSPEEYERHHLVTLPQYVKQKFHERKISMKTE